MARDDLDIKEVLDIKQQLPISDVQPELRDELWEHRTLAVKIIARMTAAAVV